MISQLLQQNDELEFKIRDLELQHSTLISNIKKSKKELTKLKSDEDLYTKAHELSIIVLQRCQNNLKNQIEGLVALCLRDIMGDEYSFELQFEPKRGQLECTPWILYGGNKLDPKISVGGGLIDICGAALKIITWYLDPERTDTIMIMDEPFRHLSQSRQLHASKVLRSLSDSLGLQFLIITHSELLASSAERIYKTEKNEGGTILSILSNN